MRLTDYTDYSLRVMLYLAVRPEGLTTIQEISDAYGISKNHLMKVVQRLGELGWIETVRGRNGGLKLNERSAALTIGEVVRNTENDFAIVGCFAGDDEAAPPLRDPAALPSERRVRRRARCLPRRARQTHRRRTGGAG